MGDSTIKELSVEIRLRNNRIRQRRQETGLSQRALAKAIGRISSTSTICGFETMRITPFTKKGEWKKIVKDLAMYFDVTPGELFPEALRDIKTPSVEKRMDVEACRALIGNATRELSTGEMPRKMEMATDLRSALKGLTPREEKVLQMRFFDDMTLEDVAESFNVGKERIRQIEVKACRKLKGSRAIRLMGQEIGITKAD